MRKLVLLAGLLIFGTSAASAQSTSKYGVPAYTAASFPSFTVAKLPLCSAQHAGVVFMVTDASSPTYNATLTGGSTTKTLALCDGTNWVAH